ncbi:MAG TPA: hypothetical protein VN956_02300 [Pyrinomonadaceae bacterium]|nr:hypothetical protein [Pyrinomonadaceae bacterium]
MKIRNLITDTVIVAALTSFLTCCRAPVQTGKPPQNSPPIKTTSSPQPSPEAELSVSDFIKQIPFIEEEKRAGMSRAWSRVPNSARYRAAQKGDFENPFMTSDYGELAGAYGLATLIVDKTAKDPKRMSLIIFVERPDNRSDIYWIYRDMDLSKYRMSRASGDIFIDEVHDDGSKVVCEIRWDKKERTWACRGL